MASESSNPRYVALLALVAALILTIGGLIRPKRPADEPTLQSVLPQAERARLDRLAQRGSLENQVAYFAQIASEVAPQVVRVGAIKSSGVVWDSEGLIVTANTKERFPEAATLENDQVGAMEAHTTSAPPPLPIAVLRALDGRRFRPVQRFPVVVPFTGEWIVAVWRADAQSHSFAPGLFLGNSPATCGEFPLEEMLSNLPLTAAMSGGGLFDQDGRLLALIIGCGDRPAAMTVESIAKTLKAAVSLEGRLLTRYGMQPAPLEKLGKTYFQAETGALIKEVWKGYPADRAGLLPGDIIVALEGQPVHSPEDLQILTLPIAREIFELGVLRAQRNLKMSLPARALHSHATSSGEAGVLLESPVSGFRIESVLTGSRAESAGIQSGDRLLRVDQATPRTAAQVRSALENDNGKPHFLILERRGRMWGLFVE